MKRHDLVVIGASAGGVEALGQLVQALPEGFPAAVLAVVHFPPHATSMLPLILSRRGRLRAVHAEDGAEIEPGTVYVAPPDRHLLVHGGRLRLTRGPRENGHRPAADALFRSAAREYGPRVVGVVLSGTLDDGTAGLSTVRRRGGVTVAQHPDDALFAGMPKTAIEAGVVDHVLPVHDIAALLTRLAETPAPEEAAVDHPLDDFEAALAEMRPGALFPDEPPGKPAGLTCPECMGSLYEIHDGELVRYRCRVGHGYGNDTLLAEQGDKVERALWTAMQVLNERAALARRTAERMESRGSVRVASRFREIADHADEQAQVVDAALRLVAASGEDGRVHHEQSG
jgi:two-component system, chemotaxis family, protein-glutamate methylesterase/glutaminase